MQVIWKTLCHQKHSVPLHAIISRKVSCVFNVKLVPWKSLSALSQAKCYIKYARKIELWSMENLKLYTLANFFIIKTIGKLLQTATLKGLVIIYHLCGDKWDKCEGLCWWTTLLESQYNLPDTSPCGSLHFFMIPTLSLSSPVYWYSISTVFFPHTLLAKTNSFSVPPWETLWSSKILHVTGHK